tara:strand:+ start:18609 stop:18977 length:369 start_codon:yes stop_codon:yes gene_type:complete
MMRLFFILLFLYSFTSSAQDSTHVKEILDSWIFARKNTYSPYQSVSCVDHKYKVYIECPIEHFTFTIYNRWGEQVFFTNDINEYWIPYEIKDGAYIWHVTGTMIENAVEVKVQKSGHVLVFD